MSLKLKKIEVKKPKGMDKMMPMEDMMMSYPPSFSANEKQIPEITDWKVGEKYIIVMEVEMKRMSSYDNGTKKNTDASFDVVAYSVVEGDDYENMSDEDLEKLQGKVQGGN